MNAVVFYSNTGQSKAIAAYLAKQLGFPLWEMKKTKTRHYENLVLVFPVHCQNIPFPINGFLKSITVTHLTVIATYGKMCCGNVLYEIQKNYQKNITAGAYVPTKHAYIDDDTAFREFDKLIPIIQKIKNPSIIKLPKLYKNPLANIFPKLRSRLGSRIYKTANCNGCGTCEKQCALGAIKSGKTNFKCIRCLKCIDICPRHALYSRYRLPMKLYLRKKRMTDLIIYI